MAVVIQDTKILNIYIIGEMYPKRGVTEAQSTAMAAANEAFALCCFVTDTRCSMSRHFLNKIKILSFFAKMRTK